jgi:uncharacterized membrane protein
MNLITKEQKIEKELHVSAYIVIYKFVLGMAEFVSGIVLWFFGQKIYQLYQTGILKELSEDPHDLLANFSQSIIPNLFTHNTFLIVYLILLGFVKIAGAIGLIYRKNWGVDLLVGLTIVLAPFQVFNLITNPNIFDLFYFLVGIIIALYLIEFRPKAWISKFFNI